jgi:rhodanese-related sulfurtransferase
MTLEEVLRSGNYHLIDVREPLELEIEGKIEGAQNIPLGEIEERKDEILKIDKPIVAFCKSGNRSGRTLDLLSSEGLKNGYNGGGWAELKEKLENL